MRQVELPHPPATGAVERPDVVELDDGVAERVEAKWRANAAYPLPIPAELRGLPCCSAVRGL